MSDYVKETLDNLRDTLEHHDRTLVWLLDNPDGECWVDLLDQLSPLATNTVLYNCGRLEGYAAAVNNLTILELLDVLDLDLED